jgi:hypothetical protein
VILGPYITSVLRLLLPSEFQRDLAAAEQSLQGAEDPESLLQLGKVLLCAGKVKLARERFNRANEAGVDPSQRALVEAYRVLADFADFGACREWGPGRPPLDIALRWSLSGWSVERDFWYPRLPALPTPVHDEIWFVTQIAPLPNELASADGAGEIEVLRTRLREAMQRFGAEGLPAELAIGVLAVHVVASVRFVDGRTEAPLVAVQGAELCRGAGHTVGEALFGLLGHELSTTASTVPEALDLFAGEASELRRTTLSYLEEAREAAPRSAGAQPLDWGGTRSNFEASGWDLGLGAGLVLEASWMNRVKPKDATATFEIKALVEAKAAFKRAGDTSGCQLVDCHLLVLGIEQNHPMPEALATANRLGSWGRTEGSTSFALGLGLLLMAVGRRWQRRGYPERALNAVRLARAVFEDLEAPAAGADAAFEEAEVMASGWESAYAVPSLFTAFEASRQLLTEPGLPDPDYLAAWQRLRSRFARTALYLLACSANHPAAVERTWSQLMEVGVLPRPET